MKCRCICSIKLDSICKELPNLKTFNIFNCFQLSWNNKFLLCTYRVLESDLLGISSWLFHNEELLLNISKICRNVTSISQQQVVKIFRTGTNLIVIIVVEAKRVVEEIEPR